MALNHSSHAHQANQRKLGVHLRHGVPQGRSQVVWVGTRADHESKRRHRPLKHRLEDLRLLASGIGKSLGVAHNTDDLAPFRGRDAHIEPDLFSEWLLVLQMAMHKLLVDQDDARPCGVVPLCKRPAAQQRNACGLKILRGNHKIESAEPLVGRNFGLAFDEEGDAVRSGCRQVGRNRNGLGAWNLAQPKKHIPQECSLLASIFVLCRIEGHTGGKEMIRTETQVLMVDNREPTDKKPGPDEKEEGQRDFTCDHHGSQAAVRMPRGGGAAFVFEVFVDVRSCCLQRWRKAAQSCGGQRNG